MVIHVKKGRPRVDDDVVVHVRKGRPRVDDDAVIHVMKGRPRVDDDVVIHVRYYRPRVDDGELLEIRRVRARSNVLSYLYSIVVDSTPTNKRHSRTQFNVHGREPRVRGPDPGFVKVG